MVSEKQPSPKKTKTSKKVRNHKTVTLAEMLITEFQLKKDGDYIRFKEGHSKLSNSLANATRQIGLKYQSKNVQPELMQLVHYASFVKNPLRYIFDMIQHADTTQQIKKNRVEAVHRIVKQAMDEDPLSTVKSIICSLARVVRF
jgi:hypothetical protein